MEHLRSFGCKDLDAIQNPNLRLTALGDGLTVQLLSNLEPLGDYSLNVLGNMGGKMLGYNWRHQNWWFLKVFLDPFKSGLAFIIPFYHLIFLQQLEDWLTSSSQM